MKSTTCPVPITSTGSEQYLSSLNCITVAVNDLLGSTMRCDEGHSLRVDHSYELKHRIIDCLQRCCVDWLMVRNAVTQYPDLVQFSVYIFTASLATMGERMP